VTVIQGPVEHGADGSDIAQKFTQSSTGHLEVSRVTEALVAAHDDFQQILGGGTGAFAHAEVVDEQRHSDHRFHILFARAARDLVGQFIQQDVVLNRIKHLSRKPNCP